MDSLTSCEAEASPALLEEYQQWRAVGAGGAPFDWNGFISCKKASISLARDDTTNLALYDSPAQYATGWKEATEAQRRAAQTSFLRQPLPERTGPRARAKHFVFPQRERNEAEPQDPLVLAAYQTALDRLGEVNKRFVEWKTSVLEKHGRALFLQQQQQQDCVVTPPLTWSSQGEICHLHRSDLSGHVTLSFADARLVIATGWGERHRLSGTESLHLGYTMLYVPRNVAEVQVLAQIYQAGIDYMKSEVVGHE